MEDTRESIRNIKKELRLFMNGITSAQLRKMGMQYNIIFGVDIPHLKEIAAKFPKDKALAHELWRENIRESKLLAIFLLPEEEYPCVAEKWIEECRYSENADHLAHSILCKLPDAVEKALCWIGNKKELTRYCGYQTLSHLFRSGKTLSQQQESLFFEEAAALAKEPGRGNAAALRSLSLYCDNDEERTERFNKACQAVG